MSMQEREILQQEITTASYMGLGDIMQAHPDIRVFDIGSRHDDPSFMDFLLSSVDEMIAAGVTDIFFEELHADDQPLLAACQNNPNDQTKADFIQAFTGNYGGVTYIQQRNAEFFLRLADKLHGTHMQIHGLDAPRPLREAIAPLFSTQRSKVSSRLQSMIDPRRINTIQSPSTETRAALGLSLINTSLKDTWMAATVQQVLLDPNSKVVVVGGSAHTIPIEKDSYVAHYPQYNKTYPLRALSQLLNDKGYQLVSIEFTGGTDSSSLVPFEDIVSKSDRYDDFFTLTVDEKIRNELSFTLSPVDSRYYPNYVLHIPTTYRTDLADLLKLQEIE